MKVDTCFSLFSLVKEKRSNRESQKRMRGSVYHVTPSRKMASVFAVQETLYEQFHKSKIKLS